MLGITELELAHFQARHAVDGVIVVNGRGLPGLGHLQEDIGQALAMQAQHQHIHQLVDQPGHTAVELLLVGVEGNQHAGAELAIEHQPGAEPDHQHGHQAEQQAIEGTVGQLQLLRAQTGVDFLDQQAAPGAGALLLMAEQLDGAHPAHAFQKVALLPGGMHQLLFAGAPQRAEPGPAGQRIDNHGQQRDQCQRRAVGEHQAEGHQGHQAVEQGFDKRGGQGVLDRFQRAKARDDIAQVAALEEGHG
ncbi:hypothetical protein D3C79_547450 [compost metagenome]